MQRPTHDGLTLIELLIAIAVLAILAALAIPSFNALLYDSTRSSAVNAFVRTVFLARSEAMKSGHTVSMCTSANGIACDKAGGEWHKGWIAFVNIDGDDPPVRDQDETVLWLQQAWPQLRIRANRTSFSFRPHMRGVVNGTVVFCDPRGSAKARAVIINRVGRPRLAERDAENQPLQCGTG